MKTKVFQTKKERDEMLLAAAMLHFSPPYVPWTHALFEINKMAPPERRIGKGTIYTNSRNWLLYVKTFANVQNLKLEGGKVAPVQTHIENAPPTEEQTVEEPKKIESVLEELATTLSDQLFQRVVEKLQNKLKNYQPNLDWLETELPKQPEKERKKCILVVGLLPVQQAAVSNQFGKVFNLSFQESDENLHRLEYRVKKADVVVLNCTKISHKHQDMVKKFAKNREVKLSFGGTSAIIGVLEGIKQKCQTTQ